MAFVGFLCKLYGCVGSMLTFREKIHFLFSKNKSIPRNICERIEFMIIY